MRGKALLLAALLFAVQVAAQQATVYRWKLVWNENPEPDVIAYGIYVSNAPDGPYTLVTSVPDVNGQQQEWSVPEQTYDGKFFRATALNDAGLESDFSANWVRIPTKPGAPTGVNRLRLPTP